LVGLPPGRPRGRRGPMVGPSPPRSRSGRRVRASLAGCGAALAGSARAPVGPGILTPQRVHFGPSGPAHDHNSSRCAIWRELFATVPVYPLAASHLRRGPPRNPAAMSAEESDLSLVQRAQRGETGAFDALVRRYQHKVVKLVMRYVRNPTEAEIGRRRRRKRKKKGRTSSPPREKRKRRRRK